MASSVSKYDPDQPRDDHGRWGEGGGGGDPRARATASMADPRFREQHASRLDAANTEAMRNFPGEKAHSPEAHAASAKWQHAEAMRVNAEQDAHQGYGMARGAADWERLKARNAGADLVTQHEAAMAEIQRYAPGIAMHAEANRDSQSRGFADHAAEQAHLQAQLDQDSRSRGFADREAENAHHEAEQTKATRASEDAAIAAGHVSSAAREVGDHYEAAVTEHQRAAEDHADALNKAHGEAADALASLHEYSNEDHERLTLEHATPSLSEDHADTQRAFHDDLGREYHDGYERESSQREAPIHPSEADLRSGERYQPYGNAPHPSELGIDSSHEQYAAHLAAHEESLRDNAPFANHSGLEYVPHPDQSESDLTDEEHAHQLAAHETWSSRAEIAYNEALATHTAEFTRRASVAQDALERLHETQLAAHEGLKASSKAADKVVGESQKQLDKLMDDNGEGSKLVNHEAFAHHERDYGTEDNQPEHESDRHDPQYLVDNKARGDYENAHAAADSMIEHAQHRIDGEEGGRIDTTVSADSLKDSMRSTRNAIKELAGITGRAPRIGGGKTRSAKKSANRPDAAPGGSVWGMAAPSRFKLRLTKLDLISLVDTPAQESAAIRLIKRKDGTEHMEATLTARLAKIGEGADPLAYFWAFTCTTPDGSDYHDLQGDAIQPDFLKAAEDWLHTGGAMDEMHDGAANNRAAFAFPWDPDIASAMLGPDVGKLVKTSGLMIAMRPTPEQLVKLRNKEFNGVSIAGTGIRELVKAAAPKCPSCGAYGKADDDKCASCGKAMKRARPQRGVSTLKAVLSTADKDNLPDSSFLYIEPGATKDADGKTTPRSHRMFPYRDSSGKIDIVHLRAACSDVPKSSLPKDLQNKLQARAEKLLGAQHSKRAPIRKLAVLTSVTDGHQHQIDLDDPADGWSDQLTTSYNNSAGADQGHSHAWVYDEAGKITIALDSGHTHTIDAVVPADVLAQAKLNDTGTRCPGCGEMCEAGCRFCPKCGCAMDRRDGVPTEAMSDDDSESGPAVIVISARAPAAISPPADPTPTVKSITEEQQMADNELAALKAENALLKHMSSLTDAARDHHNRLLAKGIKSDADAFLVLDKAQRAAVLAEISKADAEVYTSKSNGKVYRMSDSVEIIEAAKQSDAMAETMKRLETERSELEFTKAAGALIPNCLKGVKNNVPQRLIKAIRAEFKEPGELAEAEKALKQYETALAMLSKSVGYSSTDDTATDTPVKRFENAINDYAKRNNLSIPQAIAKATESDPEIRRLYNEASLLAS